MESIYEEAVARMAERRSVRSYREEHIPKQVLDSILQAGINAASGGNLQPFSILVEKDGTRKSRLAELLRYPFVSTADVDLIFVLDWHKLARYSECRQAPFVEERSTSHFFIAWDDTLISAQAVETAAWLYGIGSCFIGHVMDCTQELRELYDLPDLTFPVVMLSMGYPKVMPPKPRKLSTEMIVFEGRYPKLSDEEICAGFDKKYEGKKLPMPPNETALHERLDKFRRALLTSYTEAETEEIIAQAKALGYLSEIQRLFGIHYHPDRELGDEVTPRLHQQGLYPFTVAEETN